MVDCRRSGTFSTGLVAAGAARSSVVARVAAGVIYAYIAELLVKVRYDNLKFGEVLKGNEELGVGGSAFDGECNVGRSESCDRGAITGSGRC